VVNGRRRGVRLCRADPLDPDIVYGGKVSRWDRRTKQVQQVGPRFGRPNDYRVVRTMPVLFSPVNPRKLYFSSNVLWQTIERRTVVGSDQPDLTRKTWEIPKNVGVYSTPAGSATTQRGVIYTIAPSYLDERTIWVGTDDGLIHVTRDGGKTWNDVTPPALTPWSKVSIMDASHFRREHRLRRDQHVPPRRSAPHIYRTATAARPGRRSPTAFPTAASSTWCARIRSGAACCSPAPSRPSTCRSTTATTGSRCATTCRRHRFAIS
jgi:hypothetical protein